MKKITYPTCYIPRRYIIMNKRLITHKIRIERSKKMKKIILLLITILILLPNGIYAAPDIAFTVEPIYSPYEYPLINEGVFSPPDIVEINGVKYIWASRRNGAHPVK